MENNLMTEKEIITCFDCSDNRMNCAYCIEIEKCDGCEICGTHSYDPCIHCKIDCAHENNCIYRKDWEGEIMKKRKGKGRQKKDNMDACSSCKSRGCITSGVCPEGVFETVTKEYNLSTNNVPATTSIVTPYKTKKYNSHGKVWDTGITCIDDCPHKSEKTKLQISLDVYLKLEHLQKTFPDVEFLVYGNAEQQSDNNIFLIKDITIPKQTVGMASVDDVQCEGHWNTVIHKHPGDMPGDFSSSDDEFVNMNHDFSLLIGSKDLSRIVGVGRKKTDCGRWIRVPLDINVDIPEIKDTFFLSSLNNIEKRMYHSVSVHYPAYDKENIWDKRQREVTEWYKDRFY